MGWYTHPATAKGPKLFCSSIHGTIKVMPGETKWCPRSDEPAHPPREELERVSSGQNSVVHDGKIETVLI